ncbi:hypothetical protein MK079_03290 [Candidatus Gracilibacteria bacterium]|nr:hypothetical protein [Candidatus Gracilibacteria bacterium]
MKEFPRNVEKLFLKAECHESLDQREQSQEVYKKILNLQPYNTKAKQALTL